MLIAKPISRRAMRMLRVGGTRNAKTLAYRRMHAASYWSYWANAGEVVHAIQMGRLDNSDPHTLIEEHVDIMCDALLDSMSVPMALYSAYGADYAQERMLEDMAELG